MKGNQATGLLGLLPEDRANRARLGSERKREGIGSRMKGQVQALGGSCLTALWAWPQSPPQSMALTTLCTEKETGLPHSPPQGFPGHGSDSSPCSSLERPCKVPEGCQGSHSKAILDFHFLPTCHARGQLLHSYFYPTPGTKQRPD